ncbi:hypothetical protein GP486_003219 [Trichoglossum hirsutum]|uniref:Uncharacterized protein n=1 Tax=Trichoglossum hirsutum TaxID=265104 RepID=A0A9P8LDG9_9PEZI|nr:hypothetical protein GP486_003219 [Trichoglossum hirsutum]
MVGSTENTASSKYNLVIEGSDEMRYSLHDAVRELSPDQLANILKDIALQRLPVESIIYINDNISTPVEVKIQRRSDPVVYFKQLKPTNPRKRTIPDSPERSGKRQRPISGDLDIPKLTSLANTIIESLYHPHSSLRSYHDQHLWQDYPSSLPGIFGLVDSDSTKGRMARLILVKLLSGIEGRYSRYSVDGASICRTKACTLILELAQVKTSNPARFVRDKIGPSFDNLVNYLGEGFVFWTGGIPFRKLGRLPECEIKALQSYIGNTGFSSTLEEYTTIAKRFSDLKAVRLDDTRPYARSMGQQPKHPRNDIPPYAHNLSLCVGGARGSSDVQPLDPGVTRPYKATGSNAELQSTDTEQWPPRGVNAEQPYLSGTYGATDCNAPLYSRGQQPKHPRNDIPPYAHNLSLCVGGARGSSDVQPRSGIIGQQADHAENNIPPYGQNSLSGTYGARGNNIQSHSRTVGQLPIYAGNDPPPFALGPPYQSSTYGATGNSQLDSGFIAEQHNVLDGSF